jgi:hypothetical protein
MLEERSATRTPLRNRMLGNAFPRRLDDCRRFSCFSAPQRLLSNAFNMLWYV